MPRQRREPLRGVIDGKLDMTSKTCSRCHVTKPRTDYNKRAASRDGYQPVCRDCEKKIKAVRYAQNREAVLAKQHVTRMANPEANRARVAQWRINNPERYEARMRRYNSRPEVPQQARLRSAEWYEKNRDRALETNTLYRDTNRERLRADARERYENDPLRRRAIKIAGALRRARKLAVPYEVVDPLYVFDRDGWCCGICTESVDQLLEYPDPWSASLDHVVPLARGGHHTYDNVQCAHLQCNQKKRDSLPESMLY